MALSIKLVVSQTPKQGTAAHTNVSCVRRGRRGRAANDGDVAAERAVYESARRSQILHQTDRAGMAGNRLARNLIRRGKKYRALFKDVWRFFRRNHESQGKRLVC